MTYQAIEFDLDSGIATIRLNRPNKRNALNAQMRAELTDALRHAGSQARVVVLTGAGEAFCSGQDLGDGSDVTELDIEGTLRDEYVPMLTAIYDCPVPVMAAVNGAAAGAGANLALAADVVIATDSAVFVQAFTRIGLIPDAGGTYWLPRQVGFARAMGATLFAEPIPAPKAADWGMIWESVPDAEFDAVWRARAAHLANGPTQTFGRLKQAIRGSYDKDLAEQLAVEAHLQAECGRSRDFREGVLAFLEKRPAQYEGR